MFAHGGMDSFEDYFGKLSLAPNDVSESYERNLIYTLQDVVLPFVVPQVHFKDCWEWDKPKESHPMTIATVDSIRRIASLWKQYVEGTAEWGTIFLVRHNLNMLIPFCGCRRSLSS